MLTREIPREIPPELLNSAMSIRGYTKQPILEALYAAILESEAEGGHLEIGCFLGRSTAALAYGLKARDRGEVLTVVDQFAAPPSDPRLADGFKISDAPEYEFRRNMEERGLTVDLHVMSTALARERAVVSGPLRFAFIDGDHSYEGAKHDLEWVIPMMAHGGIVVVDDCVDGENVYHGKRFEWGVKRAVQEVLKPVARRSVAVFPGPVLIVEVA